MFRILGQMLLAMAIETNVVINVIAPSFFFFFFFFYKIHAKVFERIVFHVVPIRFE